jgi:hypothetical protein
VNKLREIIEKRLKVAKHDFGCCKFQAQNHRKIAEENEAKAQELKREIEELETSLTER